MARTARITTDDIVATAVELVRTQGHECLNVRALASALGCSTQPILYHFATMGEVRDAAYQAIDELHSAYLMTGLETAQDPLMQLGLNYVRFAHDEPRLFRLLFQTDAFGGQDLGSMVAAPEVGELVEVVAQSAGMDEAQAQQVFLAIFVTAHGFASLVANNSLSYDEALVAGVLEAAYVGAMQGKDDSPCSSF